MGVRRAIEEAVRALFGECGAARVQADVLCVAARRAVLRVPAAQLRSLRAALALSARGARVKAEAPSLQALI